MDFFFVEAPRRMMSWFFQLRNAFMSQKRLKKWSPHTLDNYILCSQPRQGSYRVPIVSSLATSGAQDPDPDGECLRLHQENMESQPWMYIWVDWTCLPQSPRTAQQQAYFDRCLRTMSAIIRNCGFTYFYPPFEPRLWILYEIAEYILTCRDAQPPTHDAEIFFQHIAEMEENGVQATLKNHSYHCSSDEDWLYLVPWIELLVLFKRLKIDVFVVRRALGGIRWAPNVENYAYGNMVRLRQFEGTLTVFGEKHIFTPFPRPKGGCARKESRKLMTST
ncbi:hypothetical protein M011DRAFT_464746 [Sporormia fimetaria CBS 119925]|uniref:Heterokaryon incompatibility domain-containing protein n=1 Tax=Sporormia fimetaria CBS 119925 TaxID=1340428 RepID=A0A6A6VK37_9PLEO|nr:hypothetical protein M011DRAFT_464746 [Sporormia fimetaria CBS 119925]